MGKQINVFENSNFLYGDVLTGVGGKTSLPWLSPKVENYKGFSDYNIKDNNCFPDYKDVLNINSSIRVVGTRPLNGLIPPRILKVKRTRPYLPEMETKLLKTGKACPYWKENGWQKIGRNYSGYYKTHYGKWEGSIKENFFGNYSYFIFSPPEELTEGSHGACFSFKGSGAYSIHFSEKPNNVSEGIIAVEMLIAESMNN